MNLEQPILNETINSNFQKLMNATKYKFSFESTWLQNIPTGAGIYAVFFENDFFYIGETASLRDRMKDIRRTYNHSFRKKLGKKIYDAKIITNKFDVEIEKQLDTLYETKLSISYLEVNYGRLEIEQHIIDKHPHLLNSTNVRMNKYKKINDQSIRKV